MQRCIELAGLGLGQAAPNPLVGSIIVHQGRIIGEGYHHQCGKAHAEVNAIHSVKNQLLLEDSTLYVNLEPCAHFGKTPPCADLIVEKKIPRVVIGCKDVFAKVDGKGIEILQKGGIEVTTGVLEKECMNLNRRFFTFHEKKRPYIVLKWAKTLDGFIDEKRDPLKPAMQKWITNNLSKILVHKWRTEESAFMVGTNTAMNDNPRLTTREWHGRNPIRLVIDRHLKLDKSLHLFNNEARTIVFNYSRNDYNELTEYTKIEKGKDELNQILAILYQNEIQSIVIEGGRQLLNGFIEQNLWDEARVFIGNKNFYNGIRSPEIKSIHFSETYIGESRLVIYQNI